MPNSNPTVPAWIPRVSAGVTVAAVGAALAGAPAWLALLVLPDFLAKALDRPQLAPITRAATRLIGPRLSAEIRRRHTEWPPKRFAARLGLGMLVAIATAYFVWPTAIAGPALAAILVALSGLEAFAGFCLGCRVYSALAHFKLVQGCAAGNCELMVDEAH